MFRGLTTNVNLLKNSIAAIAQLIDEAVFKITPEGIELVAADRAKVAAVDFRLSKDAFDEYECTEEEIKVGLNLEELLTAIKRAKKTEDIELKVDDSKTKFEVVIKGRAIRSFTIPVLELSEEELPPIDRLQFSAKAEIDIDILKQGIDDAKDVADAVIFKISQDTFEIIAESDSSRLHLKVNTGEDPSLITEGEARARYPVDYLKKFMKAAPLVDRVTIKMGTDYPMRMEFDAGTLKLALILAPRVEE